MSAPTPMTAWGLELSIHHPGQNSNLATALPPATDPPSDSSPNGAVCQVQKSPDTFFDAESGCRFARCRAPWLTQLAHLCFRPFRPVGRAHFTVHRHRGGEVLLGLLAIAPAAVKLAETEVAVSDQRTHTAGFSEGQRFAVVAFSVLGAGCGGDVTVEAEGIGLVSSSTELPHER